MNHSGLNWTFFPLINRTRLVNVKVKTDLYKVIFTFLYRFYTILLYYTYYIHLIILNVKLHFFFIIYNTPKLSLVQKIAVIPPYCGDSSPQQTVKGLVMVQDKINVGKHREIPVLSMQDICNDLFFPKHKARASQECLKTTMLMSWSSQVKVQISVQLRIYEGT